ncbi:MAG: hypothetical protein BWY76_03137 [bacterium ADurb.Bin429]|nr:MAG: hypothetical protein BWY76_03137 [bacterium ADurb.Bin429]
MEAWLRQPEPESGHLNVNADRAELLAGVEGWTQHAETGRRACEGLLLALTQKADALGQRLAEELAATEGQLLAGQQVLTLWYGEAQVKAWRDTLRRGRQMLDMEQYSELEALLKALRAELTEKTASADAREAQQQHRLYLLKALRQVCAEMGFEETAPPRYAREGDRGSDILLTVDTIARGQIAFTVALDGIRTYSALTEHECPQDFQQISQFLEEEFGIETAFHLENGEPLPVLKARGEKDEPTGIQRQMER